MKHASTPAAELYSYIYEYLHSTSTTILSTQELDDEAKMMLCISVLYQLMLFYNH